MNYIWKYIPISLILTILTSIVVLPVQSATVEELQGKISTKANQIEQLQKEIAEYNKQIEETGKQAKTFENAVKTLDITDKKLQTDIRLTESKISLANENISDLSDGISVKEEGISYNKEAMGKTLRKIQVADSFSLIETFLTYQNVSMLWNELETLEQFEKGVQEKVEELKSLKEDLEDDKASEEKRKRELVQLKATLADQKKIVEANKQEKNKLLKQTQSKESEYKKLLTQKQQQKNAFEKEMAQYESELKIAIDPNSIPKASAIFSWPFDVTKINPIKNITQLFGGTEFAKLNPQVYGRPFHNGLDVGMSIGMEVRSAMGGVIQDSGNTDVFPGCYSYGKWVLVKHPNGLSTLYAHLSLIKASVGESVSTGSLVGYSGNTGYSTGPHLHFTVYVTKGVEVIRFGESKKVTNCANARIPVAPYNAYLDPMTYLPAK
ncbi:MAG: peptidoglycan DD-metalloendopeptidase family protein [Patescibacteria group bacterium]